MKKQFTTDCVSRNAFSAIIKKNGWLYKAGISLLILSVCMRNATAQTVTTIMGNGDYLPNVVGGYATEGGINTSNVVIDRLGNMFTTSNNLIYKTGADGIMTIFAGTGTAGFSGDGGLATSAQLNNTSLLSLGDNDDVIIVDAGNHRIRSINRLDNKISTIAGNGAAYVFPNPLADGVSPTLDALGEINSMDFSFTQHALLISFNGIVRKITATAITTLGGGGAPSLITAPDGAPAIGTYIRAEEVCWESGDDYFLVDHNCIRKVTGGIISTIAGVRDIVGGYAGNGGLASTALFKLITGIIYRSGKLFITDSPNNQVRKIDFSTNIISMVMGDVTGGSPRSGYNGDGFNPTVTPMSFPTEAISFRENEISAAGDINFAIIDRLNQRIRYVNYTGITMPLGRVSQYLKVAPPTFQTFYLGDDIIASIQPTGSNPVSGGVIVTEVIDPVLNYFMGVAYLQRHYDIEPLIGASTATATVTLYYTQADFTNFNTAVGTTQPHLPANPYDYAGISNIHFTQCHGTGTAPGFYVGWAGAGPDIVSLNPSSVTWNSGANRWEVKLVVNGFSGFYLQSRITILPVTLMDFTAQKQANHVLLQWATASETNSREFIIQRSLDNLDFSNIGKVTAAGNSNLQNKYSFPDLASNSSSPYSYYRLSLVDKDDNFTYSNVVQIKNNAITKAVSVAGNIVQSEAMLHINSAKTGQIYLTVVNTAGQTITHITHNHTSQFTQLSIATSNWAPGLYYLKVVGAFGTETVTIIKK